MIYRCNDNINNKKLKKIYYGIKICYNIVLNMTYPLNYDFGQNWKYVVPFLDNPKIRKAIAKGIKSFLSGSIYVTYRRNIPPSRYSRYTKMENNPYKILMKKLFHENIEAMRENNLLTKEYLKVEEYYSNC